MEIHLITYADALQLAAAVKDLHDEQTARVSLELPLRANLSARENVALIPLSQKHFDAVESSRQAQHLLQELGFAEIADKRDPDMNAAERIVTKLARALILKRPAGASPRRPSLSASTRSRRNWPSSRSSTARPAAEPACTRRSRSPPSTTRPERTSP